MSCPENDDCDTVMARNRVEYAKFLSGTVGE